MDDFFGNFLDVLFYTLWFMIMIAFIFVLIRIITDVFRDKELGGWGKTGWLIFIILLPILGALVYLFARGNGMAARDAKEAAGYRAAQLEYTKGLVNEAGGSPTAAIAQAKELLDAGAITEDEFAALKAKALA